MRYKSAMNQASTLQQNIPQPDLDSYTDLSVGEILRRTREHYGQTLPQVEMNLRIRASQLEALENLDLDTLPGRVYAIGFVRSYSEYLGLDGDKMVHLFKAQSVGKRVKPDLQFPVAVSESKAPNIYIILFSLVGLILLVSYLTIFYTPTKYVEAIPPVPEALKQSIITPAKTVAEEPPETLLETIKAKATPKSNKMELVISEDSWVEIKNSEGKTILQQVLKTGDKYIVPQKQGQVEQGLVLTTGNAGGITIFVDGKKIKKLGNSTQVKRNVALDPEVFAKE